MLLPDTHHYTIGVGDKLCEKGSCICIVHAIRLYFIILDGAKNVCQNTGLNGKWQYYNIRNY